MTRKIGDIETSNIEVRSFDIDMSIEEYNKLPKHNLWMVLDNLRSAFNVGAIFRLCDILRVKGLLLCGYTAHPPHLKLEKTSLGTIDYVPWQHFETTHEAVIWLRAQNIPVWAAETTSASLPYNNITWPKEVALILGNEALGVSREILDISDKIIELPTFGYKNSLNVATAAAVLGFKAIEAMPNAT